MRAFPFVSIFATLAYCSLIKQEGLYIIEKDNNYEVIEQVFLEEGVIMIGISQPTYCDRCALMERELKNAANLVRMTKEKINFGVIKVNNIDDLNLNLKINRFPTLVAIKEGQDPKVYEEGEDYDYLRFVKFMR